MARFLVLVKDIPAQDVTAEAWKIDKNTDMVLFYTKSPNGQVAFDDTTYISAAAKFAEVRAIIRISD